MFSFVVFVTFLSFHLTSSIPILSDDETKLNSIVISEINLPTEASMVVADQEIVAEPTASFLDMVENYEGMYGQENENEFDLQKRSSMTDVDDDEKFDSDAGGKSLIDRIETPDPDVKKEFENELSHNQITRDDDGETAENAHIVTEYDPNYGRKMILIPQMEENVTEYSNDASVLSVHEKENLQVHLVEQLVHQNENRHDVTTIVPEKSFTDHAIVKNPEIVEVLEHVVFESGSDLKAHEHTTLNPIHIVQIDVDPIEIIPKDRHREAKIETTTNNNDKFAGFVGIPTEDLIQPGKETTEPDNFFKATSTSSEDDVDPIETVRETLEYVAIYGKSLKHDDVSTTTEVPQIVTTLEPIYDSKTEIVEVSTKVTVNIKQEGKIESEKSSSSEESSQQSLSNKSSEESGSKEEKTKNNKVDDISVSSEETEAENVGKEDLTDERLNLRSLEFPVTQRPNALPEEVFKDAAVHEIKKKDHPDGLSLPFEVSGRQLEDDNLGNEGIAEVTMTTVFEAFEEMVTTVSDGIKLSKELKQHIETFLDDPEENKTVLDTHSEAISSKNSKNPLVDVNDLEMMKLKERSFEEEPKLSVAIIPLVAFVSGAILVTLYKFIKVKASSVRLY